MEKNKVFSSLFWKFAERIGAQGVNLIVSIILARLIAPEEYGLIALITIFITISNVFIESGLGSALVQKKDADDIDFSSVFYFNIVFALILYIILFISAPLIANFYGKSIIVPVLRVLGITIIISGLKNIQNAYVSRKMIFKKFFICTIVGTLISAVVGIIMAYKGFGVWALVTQQLTNTTIDTIMLWILVDWKPKFLFSINRLKELISYGSKLLASALLETIYSELNGLVIGKVYTPTSLAYYNKANQMPQLIVVNVNASISSVMFPVLSKEQDNKEKVKAIMKKSIKLGSYILIPLLFGLAAVATPFIKLVLTEKWIGCVLYMQILCVSYAFYPMHINNLEALKAIGRTDIYLKLEIIKKIVGISLLIISIPIGITAMVISILLSSLLATFINSFPNKKIFDYGFKEQIKDVLPILWISIIMAIVVYCLNYILSLNTFLLLLVQVIVGVMIYFILSIISKIDSLNEILEIIKNFIKPKRNGV